MRKSALLSIVVVLLSGCYKGDPVAILLGEKITLKIRHQVDGQDLVLNSSTYMNAANNTYRVTHLEYYLSDFNFANLDAQWFKAEFDPILINAANSDYEIELKGDFLKYELRAMNCMVGVPELNNYSGGLENTLENTNMAWPDIMGGGYHFMKLEGHFLDSTGNWKGFAIHLGANGNQALNVSPFVFPSSDELNTYYLTMNINSWFEGKTIYDFEKDGNYTMGIDSLMTLISENGEDCLKIDTP